jgi:hypothetical protein
MTEPTYGTSSDGVPLTKATVSRLVEEAEVGYDPAELESNRRHRGRPVVGVDPLDHTVPRTRVDSALYAALIARAETEQRPISEVVREALHRHLTSPAA